MVVRAEAWSWEQLTTPLAVNSDIVAGNTDIRTPRVFWGYGNDELLLHFVQGETQHVTESQINVALNEAYVAERRARGNISRIGAYAFGGRFAHHHTVLKTILFLILPQIFTESTVSGLLYENEFEWDDQDLTWAVRSATFSQRQVVDIE